MEPDDDIENVESVEEDSKIDDPILTDSEEAANTAEAEEVTCLCCPQTHGSTPAQRRKRVKLELPLAIY